MSEINRNKKKNKEPVRARLGPLAYMLTGKTVNHLVEPKKENNSKDDPAK